MRSAAAIVIIALGAYGSAFAGAVQIYGGQFCLAIPDDPDSSKGWMTDAIIEIKDNHIVTDLDVAITLTHTNVFDLQLFLQSPNGTLLCLNMYNFDEYFEGANYTQTIFDDEAEVPIEEAGAPFTGRFRPLESYKLSEFDDEQTYGLWRLRIYDAFYWDTGTLDSFELMVTNPEPATAILLAFGAALMTIYRKAPGYGLSSAIRSS
jgi:subtilisin-like proprotein convertase family protein